MEEMTLYDAIEFALGAANAAPPSMREEAWYAAIELLTWQALDSMAPNTYRKYIRTWFRAPKIFRTG